MYKRYWWAQTEAKKWVIGTGNFEIAWTNNKAYAKQICDALEQISEEVPCLDSDLLPTEGK